MYPRQAGWSAGEQAERQAADAAVREDAVIVQLLPQLLRLQGR